MLLLQNVQTFSKLAPANCQRKALEHAPRQRIFQPINGFSAVPCMRCLAAAAALRTGRNSGATGSSCLRSGIYGRDVSQDNSKG